MGEEPPPWIPKESPSRPGTGLHAKLGVGKQPFPLDIRISATDNPYVHTVPRKFKKKKGKAFLTGGHTRV